MKNLFIATFLISLGATAHSQSTSSKPTTLVQTQYNTEYIYKVNEKGDTVKVNNATVVLYLREETCASKAHIHYSSDKTKYCGYFVNGWKVDLIKYKLKGYPEMKAPKAY